MTDPEGTGPACNEDDRVLPLASEELHVAKRIVTSGRVRIRTAVEEREEVARLSLASEEPEITRVPVNREVDAAPTIRTEGEVTIVPVLEEVMVIEKRLVLREELHIRRRVSHDTFEAPVTLRRETAVIERHDTQADQKDDV
jgi:uncharacterized protein (TIGR02271 family)